MASAHKPLELILARNFISSISTPAFLVDAEGTLLFYNGAAGALLGVSFEEAGPMAPEEWGTAFGPYDREGRQIPIDELPLTIALRRGAPAHSHFTIRSRAGETHAIVVSALPIVAGEGQSGALAIFWPDSGDER